MSDTETVDPPDETPEPEEAPTDETTPSSDAPGD
jgi:hypothetical protein